MLPGSVESGVLLSPNDSVPVLFFVDGLTMPVTAALKPVPLDELVLLLPPLLLLPPPQAAIPRAATAPNAASPMILRLFM